MTKIAKLLILCTALCSVQAMARQELRTVPTGDSVIIGAGSCVEVPCEIPGSTSNSQPRKCTTMELNLITCEQWKSYQVEVNGPWWNETVTPIAGTERPPYYVRGTGSKAFTDADLQFIAPSGKKNRKVARSLGKAAVIVDCMAEARSINANAQPSFCQ